jgi:hypothetical protein
MEVKSLCFRKVGRGGGIEPTTLVLKAGASQKGGFPRLYTIQSFTLKDPAALVHFGPMRKAQFLLPPQDLYVIHTLDSSQTRDPHKSSVNLRPFLR